MSPATHLSFVILQSGIDLLEHCWQSTRDHHDEQIGVGPHECWREVNKLHINPDSVRILYETKNLGEIVHEVRLNNIFYVRAVHDKGEAAYDWQYMFRGW